MDQPANDNGQFQVAVVDPPWSFEDRLGRRGANAHYRVMPFEQLLRYELPPMSDHSVMFLWRVAAMPAEPLVLLDEWGFKPKCELVWRKTTRHGTPHFGLGHIVRAAHETCIVATRGKPCVKSHSVRSVFEAPVGEHSEKPDAFYALVETLYDGPYVDVFARKYRPGWHAIGDELPPLEPVGECAP